MVDYAILQDHFVDALGDYINEFEKGILRLEENSGDKSLIDTILRVAHNIKGGSGNVGLTSIYRFSQHIEDVLCLLREDAIYPDRHAINTLLRSADLLKVLMDNFIENTPCDISLFENWFREKGLLMSRACAHTTPGDKGSDMPRRDHGF